MKQELFFYAFRNILLRKMRSFLSAISILIGIMAIFTLVSFGQGVQDFLGDTAKKMGTDKLVIQPKGFGPPGTSTVAFSDEEISLLRKIGGVDEAAGLLLVQGEVKKEENTKPIFPFVSGIPMGPERRIVEEVYTLDIDKGRSLAKGDRLKAVLGYNYLVENKVFPRPVALGDKILVNGVRVDVVGFYNSLGNPEDDRNVYVTDDGFHAIFGERDYSFVMLRVEEGVSLEQLSERAAEQLRRHRNQKEGQEDFFVQTFEEILQTFSAVIGVLNGILVIIAFISLLIAAINIMNTMYTAVLERTKEIGILKSIGSPNRALVWMFVMESGMLGAAGGLLGIIAGFIISSLGGYLARHYGLGFLQPVFPLWLLVFCMAFSIGLGCIAGLLPAYQASKQVPVEALRYE